MRIIRCSSLLLLSLVQFPVTAQPGAKDVGESISPLVQLAQHHLHNLNADRAEPLLKEALLLIQETSRRGQTNHAVTLFSLGMTAFIKGDYSASERYYLQASAVYKGIVGDNHTDYAACKTNLGLVYMERGSCVKAELCLRDALEVYTATVSARQELPLIRICLGNLALRGNEVDRAEAFFLDAREDFIARGVFEGENEAVLNIRLGKVSLLRREYEKAESYYDRARQFLLEKHPQHPELDNILHDLSIMCLRQNRPKEAHQLITTATNSTRRRLGDNHPAMAWRLDTLARVDDALGNHLEAEREFHASLEIQEKTMDMVNHQTLTFLQEYIAFLKRHNRADQVQSLEMQLHGLQERLAAQTAKRVPTPP